MEINEYLKSLFLDEKECVKCTDKLEQDGFEYFRKEYSGFIQEDTLLALIRESRKKKALQRFLAGFSYCLTADEVTPQIFELFLKYKGEYRNTILMALSHAPLSIYQLQRLSKLNIDDQAFCQLVIIFCQNDCFSKNDLITLLQENISKNSQLSSLYEELCNNKSIDAVKLKILESFLGRNENKHKRVC